MKRLQDSTLFWWLLLAMGAVNIAVTVAWSDGEEAEITTRDSGT